MFLLEVTLTSEGNERLLRHMWLTNISNTDVYHCSVASVAHDEIFARCIEKKHDWTYNPVRRAFIHPPFYTPELAVNGTDEYAGTRFRIGMKESDEDLLQIVRRIVNFANEGIPEDTPNSEKHLSYYWCKEVDELDSMSMIPPEVLSEFFNSLTKYVKEGVM